LKPKGFPAFTFPVKKPRGIKTPAPPFSLGDIYPKQPGADLTGLGSTNEMRLYIALQMAGYKDIETQATIRGGRSRKGGQVLDFVVYNPTPRVIELDGTWWHRNSDEEFFDSAQIADDYGLPPIVIYDHETDTIEHAYETVIRKLGRA